MHLELQALLVVVLLVELLHERRVGADARPVPVLPRPRSCMDGVVPDVLGLAGADAIEGLVLDHVALARAPSRPTRVGHDAVRLVLDEPDRLALVTQISGLLQLLGLLEYHVPRVKPR